MHHDWARNRVQIRRGSRSWQYSYDLNGNLIAETSPVPDGENAAQHTVYYTYDDLDRPLTVQYTDWEIDAFPEATTLVELPGDHYDVYLPVLLSGDSAADSQPRESAVTAATAAADIIATASAIT
jgi:hypothetical protein